MSQRFILNGIIVAYRKIIDERYQYEQLIDRYELPKSITKGQIDAIRIYFLTYVYPNIEKRNELNEAFESLDNYIKQPSKLFQVLIDSASLIFKHGRSLPKILNSGIKALRSFREANKFENLLVSQAKKTKEEPSFSTETIYSFIKALPREDIDQFIAGTKSLFEILHDRKQVRKIIEIVSYLIVKMEKNPKTYSQQEINGLEIGYEIITKGNDLFENLGEKNQNELIDFIVKIESDTLDNIYESKI